MIGLPKRLRASLRCDAINGDSFERSVCAKQMREAADSLERADARIAELEQSVTVRDAEIARLETDLELARIGARRYETVRRMGAHQWGDAHSLNLLTGKPLDQIIDELRPFMFPQEARAGNGGDG